MKDRTERTGIAGIEKHVVTTLGDLISAAYEVVPGMGDKKLERALELLTRSPLARHMSPHVEFVR